MKLSRPVTGLLAVALLAFMVTDVLGQGRRGGGPGGPGGGQGGRGGFGQRGGGPGGFGGGDPTFGLLRNDAVKEEIELMPDQEEAIGKLMEQGRGERPDFDFRNASEEERREFFEKMQADREERSKKMKMQLEEVLLPDQMERLEQIVVQVRGVAAFRDEEIASKLGITDAQKKELEEVGQKVREEMQAKGQELRDSLRDGGNREEAFAKMRELFAEGQELAMEKAIAVLNSSQRAKYDDMKGKKFEMPEGQFGFGRGGGPGGGRGGFGGRGGGPGGGRGGAGGDGGGRRRSRPEAE